MNRKELLTIAIRAACDAASEILDVYEGRIDVNYKADRSPITEADERAHVIIKKALEKTGLPILSEEGRDIEYQMRKNWEQLWVVDPLDGTKEFIKKNDEFTVNIALVENGNPTMGVIMVPVWKRLFFADTEHGAYRIDLNSMEWDTLDQLEECGSRLPLKDVPEAYTVVTSRSHVNDATRDYLDRVRVEKEVINTKSMGSALKLCLVAEGEAHEYPRFGPTMEWDTAAGQAILEASGHQLLDWKSKEPIQYNRENLKNDWFIAR
jgi:3'(2'), 5'-bisphosphate nucleotidase